MGTQPPPQKGGGAPIFGPCLLWPNVWMDQDATCYRGRLWPRQHCVRLGPSSPFPKGLWPQFLANVHCGQTAGWTKMPLGMEIDLVPGDFLFDGDPAPPQKKRHSPTQFLAHVYCDQTAGWIKIRQSCVRWGRSSPLKSTQPPSFQFMFIVAKWLDGWRRHATWYGSRPRPWPQCVRRGPSSPLAKGAQQPPLFSAHVYCGHGRPSHLLLSSCYILPSNKWNHVDSSLL